jgi:hypothetical protein
VLIAGLVMLLAPLSIQLRSWKPPEGVSRARQYIRLVVNMTAGVPVIVAGALLTSGTGEGLHWLATGIIIALVSAVWNAWVLLVEILRWSRVREPVLTLHGVVFDIFVLTLASTTKVGDPRGRNRDPRGRNH